MENLFIQGPEKTGTSALTGILNCHPEIFILFEVYLAQNLITKYGNQLLERYPKARRFFRDHDDYGIPVLEFFEFLKGVEPNAGYRYVGTKLNSLKPSLTQEKQNYRIIFTMRDIRSWLVKESVIKYYRTDLDIVVPAMSYLKYVILSAAYPHALRIWLEDLIERNSATIELISEYLGISLQPYTNRWWEQIGNRDEDDPKSMFKLSHVHHSSRSKPEKLDTRYKLKQKSFWDEVALIFDKYKLMGSSGSISESEREKDLIAADQLIRFAPLSYFDAYDEVHSVRIGNRQSEEIRYVSEKSERMHRVLKSFRKNLQKRISSLSGIRF